MKIELLRDYQKSGVEWINNQKNCLLCDEVGLGKTAIVLNTLKPNSRTIVVCPTQVVFNWKKEGEFWREDLKYTTIDKRKNFRLPELGEVIITSYGMLPDYLIPEEGKRKLNIEPETKEILSSCVIAVDEFHRVANKNSKQSKLVKGLIKSSKKAIGMTATPIRNKPLDIWNLLSILGLQNVVFKDFFHFIKSYSGKKNHFGVWEFPENPRVSSEISENLRKIMLLRKKEDVLSQLPEKIYIPIYFEADKKELEELDSAFKLMEKISNMSSFDDELPEFSEMARVKKDIAKNNIPKMLQIVQEYEENEEPLIVASDHVEPILALKERDGWDIIVGGMTSLQKHKVIEEFQNGKLKGIGFSLRAGSEGINLDYGSHILFNDRHWTPSVNEQFIGRIDRLNQKKKKLFIKDIITDHPLVLHIYKQNINKMILAKDSIEKNNGLENLKIEKQKTVDESVYECITSCIPEWNERFSVKDKNISKEEINKLLENFEFENISNKSIINLLKKINFENCESLAFSVIQNEKDLKNI